MSGKLQTPAANQADELQLLVRPPISQGSQPWTSYTGWTEQRITRGIERCPSDFEVSATAKGPQGQLQVNIAPGWECQVMLGNDLVLCGYIDRVSPTLSPREHRISIVGRSKCQDITDCAAEASTYQINSTNALAIAQVLTKPFGITAKALGNIGNTTIQQLGVILSETAYEVIERVCRFAGLLAYDDTDGNLILTRVGSQQMASGFTQGQNIQEASADFSMDQRFSEIDVVYQSTDTLLTGPGGLTSEAALAGDTLPNASATDPNVPRHRTMVLIAGMNDYLYKVAQQQAQWEVNRRYGRSKMVRVTVDSWRDSAGTLWLVNAIAPLMLPAFGINTPTAALITEVTFRRGLDGGTLADLVLMPPSAMDVEPIVLVPFAPDVAQAVAQNGGAAAVDQ